MKKLLGSFILFLFGYKSVYHPNFRVDKCVMLGAPHTSNWDMLFGLAIYWKANIKAKFFIKNFYTRGLHGYFFRWLGGIGVDRSKHNNMVDYAVNLFNNSDKLALGVPAEGTRKRVDRWKTGFYHIAIKTNVPVCLCFVDFKKKIAGVGEVLYLSGDFEKDMTIIQDFYKDITGKHPENYNKKIF
ncbi:1-acyl-sn-glycerol-3-phosphate acyltransferase [Aureibaculum sp. 2210JD6-5]|uniref:1-acyl-sn-glycerol-3-phosphate acyltransferase n=1 Tax=Aureibaculum sp. 2210JD6-5 TaxID=3103957 RepID=UPI002AAEF65B|nr:1-acyl-sn-glycerol-3-phosphate acyltransferase [Aureibaculum sp. 2210JD6-5]MDY7394227.1 1-acyl-sn-glycerol-3-phosphate acyltransferase [Aureibaculum sp. 2210JD6-5]